MILFLKGGNPDTALYLEILSFGGFPITIILIADLGAFVFRVTFSLRL
jgi:hypothetical protein